MGMGIVLAGEKYNWEVDHPVECVVKNRVNLEGQTKLTDGIWLSRRTITAALEEESASLLSSPGAMIIVPETSKIAEGNKASMCYILILELRGVPQHLCVKKHGPQPRCGTT